MILVLGGTTEGRMAVEVLEEAGKPFYYSTKGEEQQVMLHHGIRLTGGLNEQEMKDFCLQQGIRLLVDAAHPFAQELHTTVAHTAEWLSLPVVRLERIYPSFPTDSLVWCRDYTEAITRLQAARVSVLLALTGVQTIGKLKDFWLEAPCCYFRILDRESSRKLAQQYGFPSEHLCYYKGEGYDKELMQQLAPDAILLKESGITGGFLQKVEAARDLGIRVFVIRRPDLPDSFITVNGPHGFRRSVEQLVPDFYALHSGLTTGTCATAAAVAAVEYQWDRKDIDDVAVKLPNGETIQVAVASIQKKEGFDVLATVVKDAGDDPDITNGTSICAEVHYEGACVLDTLFGESNYLVQIEGGKGIGKVTLPGLGLPVGSAAINTIPRSMLEENVRRVLQEKQALTGRYIITISVPDGEALAARTFNPRLGVVGGISIIGTSGIVKPFSSEAFVDSIRKSMKVACATGSDRIVINSGAKSERFLQARFPNLPVQAFVHYGNFIGDTLQIAAELKVPHLVMGLMIGKAVKLAEGHLDTHSKHTVLNKHFLLQLAEEVGCSAYTLQQIQSVTLARELWQILPESELLPFIKRLLTNCYRQCAPLLPHGKLEMLLIAEDGQIYDVL